MRLDVTASKCAVCFFCSGPASCKTGEYSEQVSSTRFAEQRCFQSGRKAPVTFACCTSLTFSYQTPCFGSCEQEVPDLALEATVLNRLAVLEALCASQAHTVTQLQAEINDLHGSLAGSAVAEVPSAADGVAVAAVTRLQTCHAVLQTSPSLICHVSLNVMHFAAKAGIAHVAYFIQGTVFRP